MGVVGGLSPPPFYFIFRKYNKKNNPRNKRSLFIVDFLLYIYTYFVLFILIAVVSFVKPLCLSACPLIQLLSEYDVGKTMTVETHCRWLVGLSSLSWLHLMSCCLFVYLPAGSVANWDGTPACGG